MFVIYAYYFLVRVFSRLLASFIVFFFLLKNTQFEAEDSFNGNGSLGDSIGAVER